MDFVGTITHKEIAIATLIFCTIAALQPFLESRLHKIFAHNPPFQWGWDNFFSPVMRAAMIVLFVFVAYPALFGLTTAPDVIQLLGEDDLRPNTLVGILFLVGLFAPMIPIFGRHPEFVLPVQGALATGYLFAWLADYLGVTTASVWPRIDTLVLMVGVSYFAHRLARSVGKPAGDWLDNRLGTTGCDVVVMHVVELYAQIPVILIYGYGLGRQLSM